MSNDGTLHEPVRVEHDLQTIAGMIMGMDVSSMRLERLNSISSIAIQDDVPVLFIKTLKSDSLASLTGLLSAPLSDASREAVAAPLAFDKSSGVAIFDYLEPRGRFDEYLLATAFGESDAFRALGKALAAFHDIPGQASPDGPNLVPALDMELDLLDPTVHTIANGPGGDFRKLLAYIHRMRAVDFPSPDGRDDTPRVLTHGDIKFDNLFYQTAQQRVRLIDLEQCRVDSPAIDLGSTVGEYFRTWLGSIRFDDASTIEASIAAASIPFSLVMGAIRDTLVAYRENLAAALVRPRTVIAAAGSHMLRSALSALMATGRFDATCWSRAHVGMMLLQHPDRFAAKIVPWQGT